MVYISIFLTKIYKEYKETGLKATNSYKDGNDIYKQYLDERTEKADTHIRTHLGFDNAIFCNQMLQNMHIDTKCLYWFYL
jgi:hypothetical protein